MKGANERFTVNFSGFDHWVYLLSFGIDLSFVSSTIFNNNTTGLSR